MIILATKSGTRFAAGPSPSSRQARSRNGLIPLMPMTDSRLYPPMRGLARISLSLHKTTLPT